MVLVGPVFFALTPEFSVPTGSIVVATLISLAVALLGAVLPLFQVRRLPMPDALRIE